MKYIYLILISLLLNACSPDKNSSTKIIITGSSTIAPLMNDIARRYEALHPDIRVDVQTGGSSRGVNDTRKQLANLGMASRVLKANESDLQAHTIAWDGVTVILHKNNPVTILSNQQVIDIYTGKITRWSELGGADKEIIVVNKSAGHSTLALFLNYFDLKGSDIQADIIIGDNQQGLKTVAGNPYAIGYVSIGSASFEAKSGAAIQLLPIAGVEPTLDNILQQTFPLLRPLNLVTLISEDSVAVHQLIDYAQSDQVADLIREHFFIPVTSP